MYLKLWQDADGCERWNMWKLMTLAEKDRVRDLSGLTAQLIPYEGDRVEVVDQWGDTRRFWVGKSTGWRPCHLEIHNARSSGGGAASDRYNQITRIRRGPRR
jgi:hypothetical protein